MKSPTPQCPYVGLRPYREEDYKLFFGRDREIRVISSNLQARPLTVLYGASGVGKSSVLQAGVVRRLKQQSGAAVLYFRDWQSQSLLSGILQQASELVNGNGAEARPEPAKRTFLLLDQFEEFLLYHATDSWGEQFASVLSQIINRRDGQTNVLIGIRDDGLYKLDRRFNLRIPNLLRDTLEVERMDDKGATEAIVQPLAVVSESLSGDKQYTVEPELVLAILHQVQAGHVHVSDSAGIGSTRLRPKEVRIETAYLQLVLTKLWEEEQRKWEEQRKKGEVHFRRLDPSAGVSLRSENLTLHLKTLNDLGGAENIVRNHVSSVMSQLATNRQRDIAAKMFQYLVTPSRSKIAQATSDLVTWAEHPESEVRPVLDALTDRSESRILRRLSDPEQYEIFHDVLAQPLLDWRRAHSEALERKRALRLIFLAIALVIVFGALTIYALIERHKAINLTAQVRKQAALAEVQKTQAQSYQAQAEEALAKQQAAEAARAGDQAAAKLLQQRADSYASQAALYNQNVQNQKQALDVATKDAFDKIQALTRERDQARQDLQSAHTQNTNLKSQLDTANQRLEELQKNEKNYPQGPAQRALPKAAPQEQKQNPEHKQSPQPPSSLTVTPGQAANSRTAPAVPEPNLEVGTEVCAVLGRSISAASKLNSKVRIRVTSPPAVFGYFMNGILSTVREDRAKKTTTLGMDFLDLRSTSYVIPIAARIKSVNTTFDKKNPLRIDDEGNITGHGIGYVSSQAVICSELTRVGLAEVIPIPARK